MTKATLTPEEVNALRERESRCLVYDQRHDGRICADCRDLLCDSLLAAWEELQEVREMVRAAREVAAEAQREASIAMRDEVAARNESSLRGEGLNRIARAVIGPGTNGTASPHGVADAVDSLRADLSAALRRVEAMGVVVEAARNLRTEQMALDAANGITVPAMNVVPVPLDPATRKADYAWAILDAALQSLDSLREVPNGK